MTQWTLPLEAEIGGVSYKIYADYRDILNIIRHLDDPHEPEFIRWLVALALFYDEEIPAESQADAIEYLVRFINCGKTEDPVPAPRLLDWEKDAQIIVADVNKVAGCEIRVLPFLHWWTFVAYFNAIGEGQLSTLVSIRDKLSRHVKLEKWERDFYRKNRSLVDLPRRSPPVGRAGKEWLDKLGGK